MSALVLGSGLCVLLYSMMMIMVSCSPAYVYWNVVASTADVDYNLQLTTVFTPSVGDEGSSMFFASRYLVTSVRGTRSLHLSSGGDAVSSVVYVNTATDIHYQFDQVLKPYASGDSAAEPFFDSGLGLAFALSPPQLATSTSSQNLSYVGFGYQTFGTSGVTYYETGSVNGVFSVANAFLTLTVTMAPSNTFTLLLSNGNVNYYLTLTGSYGPTPYDGGPTTADAQYLVTSGYGARVLYSDGGDVITTLNLVSIDDLAIVDPVPSPLLFSFNNLLRPYASPFASSGQSLFVGGDLGGVAFNTTYPEASGANNTTPLSYYKLTFTDGFTNYDPTLPPNYVTYWDVGLVSAGRNAMGLYGENVIALGIGPTSCQPALTSDFTMTAAESYASYSALLTGVYTAWPLDGGPLGPAARYLITGVVGTRAVLVPNSHPLVSQLSVLPAPVLLGGENLFFPWDNLLFPFTSLLVDGGPLDPNGLSFGLTPAQYPEIPPIVAPVSQMRIYYGGPFCRQNGVDAFCEGWIQDAAAELYTTLYLTSFSVVPAAANALLVASISVNLTFPQSSYLLVLLAVYEPLTGDGGPSSPAALYRVISAHGTRTMLQRRPDVSLVSAVSLLDQAGAPNGSSVFSFDNLIHPFALNASLLNTTGLAFRVSPAQPAISGGSLTSLFKIDQGQFGPPSEVEELVAVTVGVTAPTAYQVGLMNVSATLINVSMDRSGALPSSSSSSSSLPSSSSSSSSLSSSSSSSSSSSPPPLSSLSSSSTPPLPLSTSSSRIAGVLGDPQFMGLRGQSFQVHGIDGAVYNLIADHGLFVNARFGFRSSGRCPAVPEPSNCWSHAGSYLDEVGVVTPDGDKLHLTSGGWNEGFSFVTLNGANLSVGTHATAYRFDALLLSTHSLRLMVGNFELQLENSDRFINIVQMRVLEWPKLSSHGLLGQTWHRPSKAGRQVTDIEGDIDDYVEQNNDLMGSAFVYGVKSGSLE